MANRSDLYALDFSPGEWPRANGDTIVAIGQWNYAIPLSFELLLAGAADEVPSLIFDYPRPIALLDDYSTGLGRLCDLLGNPRLMEHFDADAIADMKRSAQAFVAAVGDRRCFLLEPGELYEMDEASLEAQNAATAARLRQPDISIEAALRDMAARPKDTYWLLGMDAWSHVLYDTFDDD